LQKKIAFYPTFRSLAKKQESFHFFAKFRFNLIREEMRNFRGTENEKILRKNVKFEKFIIFARIHQKDKIQNPEICFREISLLFAFFALFIFAKFREKVGDMRTKFSHFFPETSRSLQTLLLTNKYSLL